MTPTGFVLRQLRGRPLRSVLTVGAFSLSVGLLGFLLLLSRALEREWSPFMAQRVIVMAKTSFFDRLPGAYLAKIAATDGVARVCALDFVVGFYRDNRPENQIPIQAAPADDLLAVYREADVPPAEAEAWKADPRGALIGPILVKQHGWKVGDHVVLKAPVSGGVVETTVRAVTRYKLDNGVYLHRRYFEGLTGEKGEAAMFWVLARSRGDVDRVTASLDRTFETAPVPVRAMTERQWQLSFLEMLGNVKTLLGSVGLATAFALLLVTSNTLAMSARERRSETAVLRVLGFSKGAVAAFLLGEALFYGLAGAVLGSGLMYAFGRGIAAALEGTAYAGMGALLYPDLVTFGFCAVVAGVVAVLSGIVPALGVTRQPVAQLLRETR